MRRLSHPSLPLVLCLLAACGAATKSADNPTERVLVTDSNGQIIRRSALGESSVATIDAPVATLWPALAAAYAAVGIEANFADQGARRYGARNISFPRTLKGRRIGTFFSCGSGITGALVEQGTVTADVITTLTATPDGRTTATTSVQGSLRRNEGASADPVSCASTGVLAEMLRKEIMLRLATQ
jgi:hypothetical protein